MPELCPSYFSQLQTLNVGAIRADTVYFITAVKDDFSNLNRLSKTLGQIATKEKVESTVSCPTICKGILGAGGFCQRGWRH